MNDSAFSMNWITGLSGGRKVVPSAGTPVSLSSTSVACTAVVIQPLSSNAGIITAGGSDVSCAIGAENGIALIPGQPMTIPINDLMRVFIDADISGEGVQFLTLKG